MTGLDAVDARILKLLREDGRLNIRTLADQVDLPETTARDRLHRLEREGYVRGYQALVDPKAVGLTVHAMVILEAPEGQRVRVADALWRDPSVLGGNALAERPEGLVIRVAARDTQRLGRTLEKWRQDLDVEIRELLLLDEWKGQPLNLEEMEWDQAVLRTLRTGW